MEEVKRPDCPDCRIPMEPIENTIWKDEQEKDPNNVIFRCPNCNSRTKIPKEKEKKTYILGSPNCVAL